MVMDAVGSAASALGDALGLTKSNKAKLKCVGDNMPDGPTEIECMFNPTEYSLARQVNVTRNNATSTPGGTPEYTGTDAMTLTMELFFDDFASAKGDVTPKITTLLTWTLPTKRSHDRNQPRPPQVSFEWGGNKQLSGFSGYLKSVNVRYTVFRVDGTPVQAKVQLSIEGDSEYLTGTNPTSHATGNRRVHTVIDGDSLQSVAYRELGKAAYWRAIAALNEIDDPMRLAPGTVLLIPSVADAARTS